MTAMGKSRPGFLDSSDPVETASKPIYAKKITPAAAVTPAAPWGANGTKFPLWNAVKATMMKKIKIASLITTMTALTVVLSRVPRVSNTVITATMNTAVILNTPPSDGDLEIASGSSKPKAACRNSLTLPPQPTATPATETPYSKIRSQPMMKATSSPNVA